MNRPQISIQIGGATISVRANPNGDGTLIDLSASDQIRREAEERFTLALNGDAVMDHSSGLMWARDVSDELTWDDAFKYCQDFRLGGFTDWRMALLHERTAIIDYDRHDPAMNPLFKACSDYEWTAKRTHWTEDKAGSSRSFWVVYMGYGLVHHGHAASEFRARPVRVASPAGQ